MEDIRELKRRRAMIKGQVTRVLNFFNTDGERTVAEARVRQVKLDECWQKFEEVQALIEMMPTQDEAAAAEQQRDSEAERQLFEDSYYTGAQKIDEVINGRQVNNGPPAIQHINPQMLPQNQAQQLIIGAPRNKTRLPEMKLVEFDGDYSKWLYFKNSFETSIHSLPDSQLSKMDKHQYLRSVLQGEALEVVKSFQITEESYEEAWNLLKDTYDDEILIIETHLEELLNFPSVSKENKSEDIRKFVWHIRTHMSSLKALGQPVQSWETMVIHLAKKKLDYGEQRDWQEAVKDRTPANMPKLDEFLKFLNDRCNMLRVLNQGRVNAVVPQPPTKRNGKKGTTAAVTIQECQICKGNHAIYKCEEFLKLSLEERKKSVMSLQLCINCLGADHFAKDCNSSTCKKCSKKHNTLLHREDKAKSREKTETGAVTAMGTSVTKDQPLRSQEGDTMNICCVQRASATVILSTAVINVQDVHGNQVKCRALLDPGSQSNIVTESLARKLKLPTQTEDRMISGINQATSNAQKAMKIQIQSIYGNFTTDLQFITLPTITQLLPQKRIDVKRIILPKNIQMADPKFEEPGKIDMLLGAGIYWKILVGSPRNQIDGQPSLQKTLLGWIVGGEMAGEGAKSTLIHLSITNEMLKQQIERFWTQEEILEPQKHTEEEEYCEEYFKKTLERENDGRFIVRLPKRDNVKLGNSKEQALKRFHALERRFVKNPQLQTEYIKFMDDYTEQQHMSITTDENQESESYTLPHQAVIRPDSLTTKLRVVFDASARTTSGASLNDKLIPGPNLQRELQDIILRFRTHEYVMTADIAQMYRQIQVNPQDRSLQKILWRRDPEDVLQVYELNTVTYGTSCAPYLAIRSLRQLAEEAKDLPTASRVVDEDCYMDDILTGARTISEAVNLQKDLTKLLMRGKFCPRKWRSNEPRVLQNLTEHVHENKLLMLDKEGAQKTLGLLWDSATDSLQYQIKEVPLTKVTKRTVLSKISQVFDPLGLISPLLINGKVIMQHLWSLNVDWDEELPQQQREKWQSYYNSLPSVNELRIPRKVTPNNQSEKFDIHGFGDASEKAFGACLYAVSTDRKGVASSNVLCAKSKVSPLKTISLPRLELEAALLLAKLYKKVKDACGNRINKVKLWSDSTIVLRWIEIEPNLLKTFVANRVTKIQAITKGVTWHHVPSADNPADLLSRGVSLERLKGENLWWHGPPWITEKDPQPAESEEPDLEVPELKPAIVLATTTEENILSRFSNFRKMVRVVAYCIRWKRKVLEGTNHKFISVEEQEHAETAIIRIVQQETFLHELHELRQKGEVQSKSRIRALDPYLDHNGIIRVGGRLRNASVASSQKHPIVLPDKHHITKIIMQEEHQRLHHCPPEQLLSAVRHRFWPLSGRREARKIVKNCFKCFRFRPAFYSVKMGDLPAERVTGFQRPFVTTGVDYAGPLQIRESRRRGRIHVSKGYVAVFTCFSTKAVHLELVTDLTSEAYLAALRRFTARRGICNTIFSDNGTNFAGASRELEEVYQFLLKENESIKENLAGRHIQWNFNPPRSPNFGGLWEAAVKVAKRHLNTMTRGMMLTFEECYTLLTEIEAIMNSRPLTALSSEPSDFSVLTPSHFLIGDTLIQPVEKDFTETADNRLSRWQTLQKVRQNFWRRWQSEYLSTLQERQKWKESGKNIQLNTLVMLKEDHLPPLHWALGRVIEVHPGSDGVVRVVSVKTQGGIFKRAVRNLCPVPMDDED